MSQLIAVVAAVFVRDESVLAFRRAPGRAAAGLWEFPGGKVEPGETPAQALVREIHEELSTEVVVGDLLTRATTDVGAAAIDLRTFWVSPVGDFPTTSTDHDQIRWLPLDDVGSLDWAAPDLPAVAILRTRAARRRRNAR